MNINRDSSGGPAKSGGLSLSSRDHFVNLAETEDRQGEILDDESNRFEGEAKDHFRAANLCRDVDAGQAEIVKAGIALSEAGRHDEAINAIEGAAFRSRVRNSPNSDWAKAFLKHARRRAVEAYVQSIQTARGSGDRHAEGALLVSLGFICGQLGKHKKAIETLRLALPLLQESADQKHEARAYWGLGAGHSKRGEIAQARIYWSVEESWRSRSGRGRLPTDAVAISRSRQRNVMNPQAPGLGSEMRSKGIKAFLWSVRACP